MTTNFADRNGADNALGDLGTVASDALSAYRVCDFTGQLAGAGATRWLASFGAQVIRIEDPVNQGRWDILRGSPPYKDDRRGIEFGSGFNNHNVEKLGVTINLRTTEGQALAADLIATCDVVTENFAAGVLEKLGLGYGKLCELRPDVVYVSNCGFGHTGPYRSYKSWGPIAQAVSGVTHASGLADQPPAGWGYSYLDHTGGYYMAMAVLMALWHRERTGEGQWVDLSCTEVGANLHGADLLDWSVNGRSARGEDRPNSNDDQEMAPHGVYRCEGENNWIAIACRSDADWTQIVQLIEQDLEADQFWPKSVRALPAKRFDSVGGRLENRDKLDVGMRAWCNESSRWDLASRLNDRGVPAAAVTRPGERIDGDIATGSRNLWPMVDHPAMGGVRVDGQPVMFSKTNWSITEPAPMLGQHNRYVFGELLGRSDDEIAVLEDRGAI